jgi:hypothetical protein
VYPAVLIYFISAGVILLASLALIVQVSLSVFFFNRRCNTWWVLACFTISFYNIYRNFSLEPFQQCKFFQRAIASCTPNPLLRRTGVSLLVWVITFDLSGKGRPTSSYATVGIALRII